ncbi:MAG TPA: outer membrane beta-barrel protein, partial [Vicinamibacteria bacterium]
GGGGALVSVLLAAALLAQSTRVVSLAAETIQGRAALRVVTTSGASAVRVARDGTTVTFTLEGAQAAGIRAPARLPPPLGALQVLAGAEGVQLRVEVPLEVPYEVRREGMDLVVLFGARERPPAPAPAATPAPTPPKDAPVPNPPAPSPPPAAPKEDSEVLELYRRILPPPGGDGLFGESAPPDAGPGGPGAGTAEGAAGGFSVIPAFDVIYVDTNGTFTDSPEPVHDQYLELHPRLDLDYAFPSGQLRGGYGMRIRRGSTFSATRSTTHLADASLQVPLGSRLTLRGSDHFARGQMETTEVDAGREYFFRLGRFTRNTLAGSLRAELGGCRLTLDLDLGGTLDTVKVDDDAGFFDYDRRSLGSGLRYAVTPGLEARLVYSFEKIPAPPERPVVESRSHLVSLTLDGELLPLVNGQLSLAYRDQKAPLAGPGGQRFRGLTGTARLTKEFSRSQRFTLSANRSTYVSSFEQNAFYVANEVGAELGVGLPASLALYGGATYHWNHYRTEAALIGEPRADRLWGFAVGLGRPLTRWAFVRADYRKEFRNSNLDPLDTETSSFSAQLGVGAFGGGWKP